MPRDALWVLPSGVTAVVTVDDDGNPIEDAPEAVVTPAEPEPVKAPDPPPQQTRQKRGRRNRR